MSVRKGKGGPAAAQEVEVRTQPPQGGVRQKPAFETRAGRIKATAWLNEDKEGRPWFSVTVTRSYKDGEGEWKQAASFGKDDLLVVAELCRTAWMFCSQQSALSSGNGNGASSGNGEIKADEDIPF